MDPTSIGFIVLLVAMSGGIAYVADIVGKKLGKKRLSFFGLRPRHTATVGTILVGILISTFTILFVLASSSEMRQSLLEGSKVRKELREDQAKLQNLEGQVKDRTNKNAELSATNGTLAKKIGERQRDLTNAQVKLAELHSKIDSLQSKISELTDDVSKKILAFNESQKKLLDATGNLKQVKKDLENNSKSLLSVEADNNDITKKNGQLVDQNDKLHVAQAKLQTDKTNLEKEINRIKQDVATLQTAKEQSQKELDQSQNDLREVQSQLRDEKAQLADTQGQLLKAEDSLVKFSYVSEVSRKQPLIFRMDEEVVRLAVPAGLSANAANGAITNLIRRARAVAQRRGAQKNRNYPEAGIFEHTDKETQQPISPEMIERDILRQIIGARTGKVLIAVSSLNAFRGEPVSLEVKVLPNPLVYSSGKLVAESVINGSRGDAAIYQELTAFLQDTVKAHALKSGMIPISNSDVSFGQVSQADVLQVIEDLHKANREIRLQAYAVGDTYAADSLKLEFRLR